MIRIDSLRISTRVGVAKVARRAGVPALAAADRLQLSNGRDGHARYFPSHDGGPSRCLSRGRRRPAPAPAHRRRPQGDARRRRRVARRARAVEPARRRGRGGRGRHRSRARGAASRSATSSPRSASTRTTRSTATSTRCGARATWWPVAATSSTATCCSRTRSRARLVGASGSAVLCASDHGVDAESMKAVARDGRLEALSKDAPVGPHPEYIGLARIDPAHGPRLAEVARALRAGRSARRLLRGRDPGARARASRSASSPVDGLAWIEIDDHDGPRAGTRRGAGPRRVRAEGSRRGRRRAATALAVWRRYMELPRYLRAVQRAATSWPRAIEESGSGPRTSTASRWSAARRSRLSWRASSPVRCRGPATRRWASRPTPSPRSRGSPRRPRCARPTRSWRWEAARRSTSPSPPARSRSCR